jgi:putative transposase
MSITKQCNILGISRSSAYYKCVEPDGRELELYQAILDVISEMPFYGYRHVACELVDRGLDTTRKQVRRVMKRFGLMAIYPKLNLSKRRQEHAVYPYLLAGKRIEYSNQVWASDITYIKVQGSFMYLVIILDLYSRKILSHRISNTLGSGFCVEALEEALCKYGTPEIFNTDQGCQFTSEEFTNVLKRNDIRISIDGRNRALDNIYVERVWRSLKYEDIYIKAYPNVIELKEGIKRYIEF